jgi:hypothetical protein
MYKDTYGNSFPIPQTMAGVEINTDSDEFLSMVLGIHFISTICNA